METIEEKRLKVAPHLAIILIGVLFFTLSQLFNPATGAEIDWVSLIFIVSFLVVVLVPYYSYKSRKEILSGGRKGWIIEVVSLFVLLVVLVTKIDFTPSGAFERGNITYIAMGILAALTLFSFNMQGRSLVTSFENAKWGRDLMMVGMIVLIVFVVKFTFELIQPYSYLGIPFTVQEGQPLTQEPIWKFSANFFAGFIENTVMVGFVGGFLYWMADSIMEFKSRNDLKRLATIAVISLAVTLIATEAHGGLYALSRDPLVSLFIGSFFYFMVATSLYFVALSASAMSHGFIDGLQSLLLQGLVSWALFFGAIIAGLAIFGFFLWSGGRLKIGKAVIASRS